MYYQIKFGKLLICLYIIKHLLKNKLQLSRTPLFSLNQYIKTSLLKELLGNQLPESYYLLIPSLYLIIKLIKLSLNLIIRTVLQVSIPNLPKIFDKISTTTYKPKISAILPITIVYIIYKATYVSYFGLDWPRSIMKE